MAKTTIKRRTAYILGAALLLLGLLIGELDPWSELWTFAEITDTGRSVAGTVRQLQRETANAVDVLDPLGDGKRAYLIDLTAMPPGQVLGKYLLIGVVLHGDGLSAPLSVRSVEIF